MHEEQEDDAEAQKQEPVDEPAVEESFIFHK